MDIDQLGDKVQEAAELISFCKDALQLTEEKVGLVLKDMESFDDAKEAESDEAVPF